MNTNYATDVLQVVKLGKYYQLKYLSTYRLGGFEETCNFGIGDDLIPLKPVSFKNNDYKLSNNISRAITTCRNIALSNEWDYFITLTLDSEKYDRFDLSKFHKDLSSFFKYLNRKFTCCIKYLLVPERHKNGAWHMHGLIRGIPLSCLSINDNGFLSFIPYSNKFGYCSLSPVVSSVAVSLYITKHLSKQIKSGVIDLGQHLYYHSRGLDHGVTIALLPATKLPDNFVFQYESEDKSYKSSFFEDSSFLSDLGLI